MSLRTRLIVAFVALSVVPLGAITWFSYSSNARAYRDAAEHESDMLAGELSTRMQLVTTQLSERVEHLMDMSSESSDGSAPAPAQTVGSKGGASAAQAPPPGVAASLESQVAERLGEAAMLLNNVELSTFSPSRGGPPSRGFGRAGRDDSAAATGTGRSGRGDQTAGAARSGRGNQGAAAGRSGRGDSPSGFARTNRGGPPPGSPAPAPPRSPSEREGLSQASRSARGDLLPSRPIPQMFGPPRMIVSPSTQVNANGQDDGIKIDLGPIRRQMFREIAPNSSPEQLTPAERQRIANEINQRLLGVVQGLKLGAAELQKQAAEAKRQAEAGSKPVETPMTRTKPAGTVGSTMTKKLALTGNRLDVSREENGKVVNQVKAEVNLPDLLATVFSVTPRERGEVPFAVDASGRIYTPTEEDREKVEVLGPAVRPESQLGATRLQDWIVVTTADPTGSGLRFGIARPVGAALMEIRKSAARSAGLGLLFIAAALVGVVPLSRGLTRNLSRLNDGVRRIAKGDYRARVPVTTHDEIGELAQAFNQMAEDVEQHQRSAIVQERIKRELELGRQIQHDMLPHEPLRVGLTEVQGVSEPAGEVGGDFFNYFEIGDGRVALLVGDVSGHGVGAALLMATIQASLRTRLALGQGLTALADELDREIQANTPGPVYSTLFVGILDRSTRVLEYVNAGHNPQYVLRRRGGLERLESSGLPIGLLAGHGYVKRQIELSAEDVLFCYTDGCVEAENELGDMFGAEELERELVAIGPLSADVVLRRMQEIIQRFRGTREPFDDATMMVVKVG